MNRTASRPTRRYNTIAVLSLVGVAATIVAVRPNSLTGRPSLQTTTTPTDTPYAPDYIEDAAEAITVSLELFPDSVQPTSQVARLVSFQTFALWDSNGIPGDTSALPTEDWWWSASEALAPIWIVAFSATGLTADVVLASSGVTDGLPLTDTRAVDGAYYVWDANAAELLAVGALRDGYPQSYAVIAAMQNAPLTPSAATAQPTLPLATVVPSITWSAADLATAYAWGTTIALWTPTP